MKTQTTEKEKKRYNFFYNGTPITKYAFEYMVGKDWESLVINGCYSWGYYHAIEIDHENN